MTEPEFQVLDSDAVQDPAVLLDCLTDMLGHQRVLQKALAMTVCLLFYEMGVFEAPPDEIDVHRGVTVRLLKQFLASVAEDSARQGAADNLIDLLEAKD